MNKLHSKKRTEQLHKERIKLLELIASGASLKKCFSSLSNTISRLKPGVRISIMFADEQGESFNRPIAPDLPSSYSEELEGAPISGFAIGTCGEAVYENQKVICKDIAKNNDNWSDEWRNLCLSNDILACLSQPIYNKQEQSVGSFMLCFDEPREPDEWEHRIAEFGANVASIAFERDRSQQALRKSRDRLASWGDDLERLHDLSTRLMMKEDVETALHEVMMACAELLHADESSVQIYDKQNEVLKLVSRLNFDETFDQLFRTVDTSSITTCAAALRQEKQVLVEDLSNDPAYADFYRIVKDYNARAAFSTPLYGNEDQLLGMFTMYWNDPHQPTDKELQLLELYTQQAARQIERKRSAEALRESKDRLASWGSDLERLHDLSTRLLMKEDVDQALHEVMTASAELLQADKCSAQIYDKHNEVLKLVSSLGFDKAFDQQFNIVDTDSITTCATALRQHERVLVKDLSKDPAYNEFYQTVEHYGARAAFSTPLYGNEDQLLGMFTMYWDNPHHPKEQEMRLLDLYTQQAARQIERKRSAEALRGSEERFRALVTASSDVVYRMSPDWSEMRHLDGRNILPDTQEPSSSWLDRYIHPNDQEQVNDAINEAIENKSMFELEHRVQQVDGTIGWTHSRAIPILDDNDEIIEWFGAAKDVTERKRAEEKLKEINETLEERVEERTESLLSYQDQLRSLASQLSKAEEEERQRLAAELHDNLGQMLAMGKMKIDALQNGQLSDQISSELDGLKELIENSLTYTRNLMSDLKPPPTLDKEDVRATIEWLAKKMEKQHDIDIRLDDDNQPKTTSEEIRTALMQCTRELLFNVIKHADVKKARINMSRLDNQVQIVVEDKGQGFNPEANTSTVTEEGRFGLFNIRERIDLLGGDTEINSTPGEGTKIKLTAPLKEVKESGMNEQPHQNEIQDSSKEDMEVIKVMLADDHEMMRKGLKEIVDEEDDLTVVAEASDGREAVTLAQKTSPDIIIMDVNMPQMDGIEATKKIRSTMPEIKVIGLSLHERQEVKDGIRSAGASAYLSKNEAFKTLCATIRSEAGRSLD